MRRRRRSAAALAGWSVLLVTAVVALHGVGGALAPPPLHHPQAIGAWLSQRQPAEAAFALLRLAALAVGWYLLAVTAAGTASRVLRLATLVRAVDVVTVPAVRRLVGGAMGLSLTATVVAGPAGVAGAVEAGGSPPVEVMRRLPDQADATPSPPPPPPLPPPTWTVAPGDSFWSVAERLVAQAAERAPSDAEIAPYWRQLVEDNRSRLRDPSNADLLFPGQVLVVPAPPTGSP